MTPNTIIACFGAAHWDTIGKANPGFDGKDRPGTVTVRPGGVAANVAIQLSRSGLQADLYSLVGCDGAGERLIDALQSEGVGTGGILKVSDYPTGRYVAVEDDTGELTGAVADCGAIGALDADAFDTAAAQEAAFWFLETNLPPQVISRLCALTPRPPLIANPVSPARAERLRPVLGSLHLLYCNRAEAEVLCSAEFENARAAAEALLRRGVGRAVVTDGPAAVCDASANGIFSAEPNKTGFASATGAGDAFLARHLAAVIDGQNAGASLQAGLTTVRKEHD